MQEVILSKNNRSIHLPLRELQRLQDIHQDVLNSLQSNQPHMYTVDGNTRLLIESYKNAMYINLRHWWNDNGTMRPTKRGIMMVEGDWRDLQQQITEHLNEMVTFQTFQMRWRKGILTLTKRGKCMKLDQYGYIHLRNHQKMVDHLIEKQLEKTIALPNLMFLKVELFNGKVYLDLRQWYELGNEVKPTSHGVKMTPADWKDLMSDNSMDDYLWQAEAAQDAYLECCQQLIGKKMRQDCEGCRHSYGGQREHSCLGQDYWIHPVLQYGVACFEEVTLSAFSKAFLDKVKTCVDEPKNFWEFCREPVMAKQLMTHLNENYDRNN